MVSVSSDKEPLQALRIIESIEVMFGRSRIVPGDKLVGRWEPRTLDLDILAVDDLIVENQLLQVPHPHMHLRAFVLQPLCDIEPNWVHPRIGSSAKELLELLPEQDRSGVRLLNVSAAFEGCAL